MTLLLHIGDLHVKARANAWANRRTAAIVRWISRRYAERAKPVLLFTGDLTDHGSEEEYAHIRDILKPLRDDYRMIFAPGNHDVGPLGNTFSAARQNNFQRNVVGELMGVAEAKTSENRMGSLYPLVRDLGDCLVVALDSCHDEQHLASGRIGDNQLEALDRILMTATKPVVALVHHHPFVRRPWLALDDAESLMRSLSGHVEVLLFGHRHLAEVWQGERRIPLIVAAGKTSKPHRRTKTYELREIEVGGGRTTTTPLAFRLSWRRQGRLRSRR